MRAFSLSARVLAGASGLGASFVAGGLAKEKYDQFKVQSLKPLVTSVKDNVNVNMKSMTVNAEEGQRERTFIMIKPDGVQRGLVGEIIKRFEQKGFKLVAIRMMRPGKEHLEEHYADLAKRPFFPGLVKYMDSGPVVAMCWEGDGAVKTGRVMLGETNPKDSKPGTIRGDYCVQVGRNICHGSDAVESANHEIKLWFTEKDLCNWTPSNDVWINEGN